MSCGDDIDIIMQRSAELRRQRDAAVLDNKRLRALVFQLEEKIANMGDSIDEQARKIADLMSAKPEFSPSANSIAQAFFGEHDG